MNETPESPMSDDLNQDPTKNQHVEYPGSQIIPTPPPPPEPSVGQYYGNQTPYAVALPNEPQAMLAMIFGILGLAVCGLLAPAGLVIGAKSRKRIRESNGAYGGEGMATAGFVCGIIGTVFLAFGLLYIIFVMFLFGSLAIGNW